jgi:hypothetical protein
MVDVRVEFGLSHAGIIRVPPPESKEPDTRSGSCW